MIRPGQILLPLMLLMPLMVGWKAPDLQEVARQQAARDAQRESLQRQRLTAARTQLAAVMNKASQDDQVFKDLQRQLQQQEQILSARLQTLQQQRGATHELYTTARQTAGDLAGLLRNSPTAPPSVDLQARLAAIAGSEKALDLDALAGLWEAMQISLGHTVTRSRDPLPVQIAPGEIQQQSVFRIGTVFAFSNEARVVFDNTAGVYRSQSAFSPDEAKRLTSDPAGVVLLPVLPGLARAASPDAIRTAVGGSGPIGLLIGILGIVGTTVLLLRALLLFRIIRSDRLAQPHSASGKLREQIDSHRNERSESLAGWLNATVRHEARKAQWGHTLLSIIIGVAPLLGLLGTVTGMILTFDALRLYGSGDPLLMADGISQALSTTLLGLCVAIPLLIGQRWLLAKANDYIRCLDGLALEITAAADSR
ncbi:MAG: MotA/TolQ/ExbB proton channel family protein [Gammaproteobacteria bacterium]|nr:MotA/TolQ/ExbB proton channel family protein [Gammaproteobacteria bacterium]